MRPGRTIKIDLYTSRFDPQCIRAKGLLDRRGLEYNEYDVESDEFSREVLLKRAEGRTSLPQIFINGRAVGGYDELEGLISSGQLDAFMSRST